MTRDVATKAVQAAQRVPGVRLAQLQGDVQIVVSYDERLTSIAEITRTVELHSGLTTHPAP